MEYLSLIRITIENISEYLRDLFKFCLTMLSVDQTVQWNDRMYVEQR